MNMRRRAAVLAIVLAAGATAGCKKTSPPPSTTAGTSSAASPVPVKPVPALLPDVIARINSDVVDRAEFERAVKSLEAQAGGPIPPDRRDEVLRDVLEQLVALKLVAQEASARRVPVADAEVEARLGDVRKQFPTEQAFAAALAERKMTLERLKQTMRQQIQAMKLIEAEVSATVSVTDADADAFYQKNPDRFKQPEAAHLAHILIRLPEQSSDATRQKARADADSVLAQTRKGGDFAALARQHSQDSGSAVNGGDLGVVPRGQMVPAFEQAAFALQPGQLSGLVETQFGFHIIKLIERKPARTIPLAEVKDQVVQFLKQEQNQTKTKAFVEKLKAKAKIEILI